MRICLLEDRRYFKKDKRSGSLVSQVGQIIPKNDIVDTQVTGEIGGNSIVCFKYKGNEFYFLADELKGRYYYVR